MQPPDLTAALKQEALRLGFDLVGVCPAQIPPNYDRFLQWIESGYAAGMKYMVDRAAARRHPANVLPDAKSVVMLAACYRTVEPAPAGPGQARVARYAWGADYHDWARGRLRKLAAFHRQLAPRAQARGVVDTAPLLERDFAQLAGLGWIGKNCQLITDRFGSYVVLAALLSTEVLEYDQPAATRCGDCRACLDACPTGALVAPGMLDARRCLSYLTIEHKGPIPEPLRPALGIRLFGCDACQEACPYNRATEPTADPAFRPAAGRNPVELADVLSLDDAQFESQFAGTPIARLGRKELQRKAEVIAANRSGR